MDESTTSNAVTGLRFLLPGFTGALLLLLGLMKNDVFLRTAVYGPVMICLFGTALLLVTLDFRHGFSAVIQSSVELKLPTMSSKQVNRGVVLALLFLSINLFWLARVVLPSNLPALFALLGFSVVVFLTVLVGLLLGGRTPMIEVDSAGVESVNEFRSISNSIVSGQFLSMNFRQQSMVLHEKDRLVQMTKNMVQGEGASERLLRALERTKRDPDAMLLEWKKLYQSGAGPFFRFHLTNEQIHEDYKNIIDAELLLEQGTEVLKFISGDKVNNEPLWTFVSVLNQLHFRSQRLPPLPRTKHTHWQTEAEHALTSFATFSRPDKDNPEWNPMYILAFQEHIVRLSEQMDAKEGKDLIEQARAWPFDKAFLNRWRHALHHLYIRIESGQSTVKGTNPLKPPYNSVHAWPGLGEEDNDGEQLTLAIAGLEPFMPKSKGLTFHDRLMVLAIVLDCSLRP